MPYTLTATQVPAPVVFSGAYSPTAAPLTSPSLVAGDTTQLLSKVNEIATRSDLNARFGGGCYALVTGLDISAGAGLTLNIAAGEAQCDGPVYLPSSTTYSLPDLSGGRAYLWLSRAGTITHTTTTTPPAGAQVFLGSAVTNAGAISSVDQSGVMTLKGPIPERQTADSSTPGDTPPGQIRFLHRGTTKLWLWDGTQYWELSQGATSTPLSVANGGTGSSTAAAARAALGIPSQLVLTPSGNVTLTAAQARNSNIELRTGGGVAAPFTATFPTVTGDPATGLVAGDEWVMTNTTGYGCKVKVSGGNDWYLANGQRKHLFCDGSDLREAGRGFPSIGAPSISGSSSPNWEEIEAERQEYSISGGSQTVTWPTSLSNKGRLQSLRNDNNGTNNLTVKASGAGAEHDTLLLPGEEILTILGNDGIIRPAITRPRTQVVSVVMSSDADKTVAHPDFLGVFLEATSSATLTATRSFILPTTNHKLWSVKNATTGGQSLLVKTSGGAGVTVPAGRTQLLYCNGTDILPAGRAEERGVTEYLVGKIFGQTASTTVANTGTETTLTGAGLGTRTIPANWLLAGRAVRVRARGYLSTTGTPNTLNLRVKLGSTTILATGDQTPAASISNGFWEIDAEITCRTAGGSGTVIGQSAFEHLAAATGNLQAWGMTATATVTVDTTASQAVDVTADWGGAGAAGDTITATNVEIELLG